MPGWTSTTICGTCWPRRPPPPPTTSARSTAAGSCPRRGAFLGVSQLSGPLPEGPSDPAKVVADLAALGGPATVASAGGRYFGFVTGATLPAALGASWLTETWDQNGCFGVMSPLGARLEEVAAGWLLDVLGLPGRGRRRLRHRRDHGQLHGARRRPPRAAGGPGLGRGRAGPVRRAADRRGGGGGGPRLR